MGLSVLFFLVLYSEGIHGPLLSGLWEADVQTGAVALICWIT